MALAWCLLMVCTGTAAGIRGPAASGSRQAQSMLQTWSAELARGGATAPYARVVELLSSIQKTLAEEMEEDKKLYEKLKCWCEDNSGEKDKAIEDSKSLIEELEANIESLAAKEAELSTTIAKVKAKTDDNKQGLSQAQALRDKQLQEYHAMELDNVQAVENLKAAIVVLGKHHDEGAFQQFSPVSLLEVRRRKDDDEEDVGESEDDEQQTWTEAHEARTVSQPLDEFMQSNGMSSYGDAEEVVDRAHGGKFLQQDAQSLTRDLLEPSGWSAQDAATIRSAVKTAGAFLQAHHEESYFPSYAAQSGEILGVLKQIKDEIEAHTKEASDLEKGRAEDFEKLRQAKSAEIEAGEKMEEQKEDELAATATALAEAKEDLGQEKAVLEENESFLENMKDTCSKADSNFEKRTKLRQAEAEAIADTIKILTEEEAKDAAATVQEATSALVQLRSTVRASARQKQARSRAAAALRVASMRSGDGELAMLATTVELDSFEKVKKAIQAMIEMLTKQQGDEVKKTDWCKGELKENEMTTLKTEDRKASVEAKLAETGSEIKKLQEGIAEGYKRVGQAMVSLQAAGLERKEQNLEFQKVVADQNVLIDVLKKALVRLQKYYGQESLAQVHRQKDGASQTPPVAQMEYEPSGGAAGVMQMLEKLTEETMAMLAETKESEQDAQVAYEAAIESSNGAIEAMQKEVVTKSKSKAKKEKAKLQAESDLASTSEELEGLSKYLADLHDECDFQLKNFDTRQDSRGAEIEALQQATQILSGASLG